MLRFIKKIFIVLLTSLVNASNHTKCVSLSNQKYETQPTLINLHPNEYSQELHCYPFAVKLDRCVGGCNTLNDLSNKVCVQNEKKDLNIHVFNVITGINESKVLTKHISCKCKCKFHGKNLIQIKNGIMINVDVNVRNIYVRKIIFEIQLYVVEKMVNI